MGTTSSTKLLKQNGGTLTEETTLTTSAGAADANKVPALNASGVLDSTIVNSKPPLRALAMPVSCRH